MSNLEPTLPLEGFTGDWPDISLVENFLGELVSLAVAQDEEIAFNKAFKKTFGKTPPKPSEIIAVKGGYAMWSSIGQYFILLDEPNIEADRELASKFGNSAYTTLQSDGWTSLDLKSKKPYDILERFIPLDLRAAQIGFAARTMAHHIAVIIIKFSETEFRLMTPRSSAKSFLGGLTHTIENVIA